MRFMPALATALMLSSVPVYANDSAQANRMIIEAVRLWNEAAKTSSRGERMKLLDATAAKLNRIIDDFPETDQAVQLATGQSIGNLSLDQVKAAMAEEQRQMEEMHYRAVSARRDRRYLEMNQRKPALEAAFPSLLQACRTAPSETCAADLLQTMIVLLGDAAAPSGYSPNAEMGALVLAGRLNEALALADLDEHWDTFDDVEMVKFLSERGKFTEARAFFKRIPNQDAVMEGFMGQVSSDQSWAALALADAFIEAGDANSADEMDRLITEPEQRFSFLAAVATLAGHQDRKGEAEALLREAEAMFVDRDEDWWGDLGALAEGYLAAGLRSDAERVLSATFRQSARAADPNYDRPVTYGLFVIGAEDEALPLVEKLRDGGVAERIANVIVRRDGADYNSLMAQYKDFPIVRIKIEEAFVRYGMIDAIRQAYKGPSGWGGCEYASLLAKAGNRKEAEEEARRILQRILSLDEAHKSAYLFGFPGACGPAIAEEDARALLKGKESKGIWFYRNAAQMRLYDVALSGLADKTLYPSERLELSVSILETFQ